MHEKLKEEVKNEFLYIFIEEIYRASSVGEITSMRSAKNMDSITSWRRLCCFAYAMKGVANTSKDYKKEEKDPEGFQNIFFCSHLSTILDRNLVADPWLSCLSQVSMIVIFVPCMNESPIGKRLASICSVSAEDVPDGVSGTFLAHLPDFMKEMVWFKKAETEDVVKGLDGFVHKLDVVAAAIFTLIDVKGELESKQQQPCYFCYYHF